MTIGETPKHEDNLPLAVSVPELFQLSDMPAVEIVELYHQIDSSFEHAGDNQANQAAPPDSLENKRHLMFTEQLKALASDALGKAIGAIGLLALCPKPSARAYAASINYTLAKADFEAALPFWVLFSKDESSEVTSVLVEDIPSLLQEPEVSRIPVGHTIPLLRAYEDARRRTSWANR